MRESRIENKGDGASEAANISFDHTSVNILWGYYRNHALKHGAVKHLQIGMPIANALLDFVCGTKYDSSGVVNFFRHLFGLNRAPEVFLDDDKHIMSGLNPNPMSIQQLKRESKKIDGMKRQTKNYQSSLWAKDAKGRRADPVPWSCPQTIQVDSVESVHE